MLGDEDPERCPTAVSVALGDDSISAVIVVLTPQALTLPAERARAVAELARRDKPVLASFAGGQDVMGARGEMPLSNLPNYPWPERAVAALRAMCDCAAWRRRPARAVTRSAAGRGLVEGIIRQDVEAGLRSPRAADAPPHTQAAHRRSIDTGPVQRLSAWRRRTQGGRAGVLRGA